MNTGDYHNNNGLLLPARKPVILDSKTLAVEEERLNTRRIKAFQDYIDTQLNQAEENGERFDFGLDGIEKLELGRTALDVFIWTLQNYLK